MGKNCVLSSWRSSWRGSKLTNYRGSAVRKMVSYLARDSESADTFTEAIHAIRGAPITKQPTKDDIEHIINEVSHIHYTMSVN
jgi:hypothetical protein